MLSPFDSSVQRWGPIAGGWIVRIKIALMNESAEELIA